MSPTQLTTQKSGSKLTHGLEQVQVVATDVVLRQVDDRTLKRILRNVKTKELKKIRTFDNSY